MNQSEIDKIAVLTASYIINNNAFLRTTVDINYNDIIMKVISLMVGVVAVLGIFGKLLDLGIKGIFAYIQSRWKKSETTHKILREKEHEKVQDEKLEKFIIASANENDRVLNNVQNTVCNGVNEIKYTTKKAKEINKQVFRQISMIPEGSIMPKMNVDKNTIYDNIKKSTYSMENHQKRLSMKEEEEKHVDLEGDIDVDEMEVEIIPKEINL